MTKTTVYRELTFGVQDTKHVPVSISLFSDPIEYMTAIMHDAMGKTATTSGVRAPEGGLFREAL